MKTIQTRLFSVGHFIEYQLKNIVLQLIGQYFPFIYTFNFNSVFNKPKSNHFCIQQYTLQKKTHNPTLLTSKKLNLQRHVHQLIDQRKRRMIRR